MKRSSRFWKIASNFNESSLEDKILLKRLYEGDETPDDNDDDNEGDDASAVPPVDAGGDTGGDAGGASGGGDGDSEGGGIGGGDEDLEDHVDRVIDASEDVQNTPNNLILSDGTDTEIAIDSSLQTEPLIPNETEPINFNSGNWGSFKSSSEDYDKSVSSVVRQFVPLVEVALIELLGNSNSYKRISFDAEPQMDSSETTMDVKLEYQTSIWLGTDIPLKSLQSDQNYIRNRISAIPDVDIKISDDGILINPNEGTLTIKASLVRQNTQLLNQSNNEEENKEEKEYKKNLM